MQPTRFCIKSSINEISYYHTNWEENVCMRQNEDSSRFDRSISVSWVFIFNHQQRQIPNCTCIHHQHLAWVFNVNYLQQLIHTQQTVSCPNSIGWIGIVNYHKQHSIQAFIHIPRCKVCVVDLPHSWLWQGSPDGNGYDHLGIKIIGLVKSKLSEGTRQEEEETKWGSKLWSAYIQI